MFIHNGDTITNMNDNKYSMLEKYLLVRILSYDMEYPFCGRIQFLSILVTSSKNRFSLASNYDG